MIRPRNPIIGLTGLKGSGKDSLAGFLVRDHGYVRLAFADPLKRSAAAALGIDEVMLEQHKNNPAARVVVVDNAGLRFGNPPLASITVREYLQKYGTEAHREVFDDDFWITPIIDRAFNLAAEHPVVITDARFENEQRAVKDAGGYVIAVERDVASGDTHASENVLHGLTDVAVANFGTLDDLQQSASELVGWLSVQSP